MSKKRRASVTSVRSGFLTSVQSTKCSHEPHKQPAANNRQFSYLSGQSKHQVNRQEVHKQKEAGSVTERNAVSQQLPSLACELTEA